MSAYAEAMTEVYETCVSTVGLDPVAMKATHDVADAAADAASAMAAARAKFASHYSEVREFAASGGLLPLRRPVDHRRRRRLTASRIRCARDRIAPGPGPYPLR